MSGSIQIDGYLSEFSRAQDELYSAIESLSYEQLNWRPNTKSWSVGHCASHLSITAAQYKPAIEAAVREAREAREASDGSAGVGLFWKFVLWIMRSPGRIKMPAPKIFLPLPKQRKKELLKEISKSHDELIAAFESAKGLDVGAVRIISPVKDSFVLTLPRCATLLLAHHERHMAQMGKIQAHAEFPTARGK